MSVVKSKRGQGKLLVYTKANELAVYTMFVLSKKVTHERRKLRKLVKLCGRQVLTREDVDKCYTAWMAHACKGNSYNLINSMTAYYNSLWR